MFNNIFSHFNKLLSGQILYIIITFQTQHTFFNICSAWKKSFFSSWNHRSLWSAAHSGLAPSLIDHKGSIIIIEQSQPRNHHNPSFAWMLSLPASHIRWTFKDENTFSSHQSYPYRSWRICGTAQCVTVPHVQWNHRIQLSVSDRIISCGHI